MKSTISYDDFDKLDMRVALIKNVDDIEGADKLLKLTLDVGNEIGERVVCAGIKEYYSAEDLKGKRCVLLVNLAPRKLKGVLSEGMILASGNKEDGKFVLISPENDVELGSSVS
jgi:methionine--tRNA ligase beta chain